MTNNSKKNRKIALALIIVAIVTMIAVLIMMLFGTSETHVSEENRHDIINVLDCETMASTNQILTSDTAIKTNHRVKLEFLGDYFDKANYTYTATYRSDEEAKTALPLLHADYNIYMGKTGVYQEDFYPTFSVINSQVIINLFMPEKLLNSSTVRFIFLNDEELNGLKKSTIKEMQEIYEDKNFACKVTNNSK